MNNCYQCKHHNCKVISQEYNYHLHCCKLQGIITQHTNEIQKTCPLTTNKKCKLRNIGEKIMNHKNDEENIMLEEKIITTKMKKQTKNYKNPNSKTMMHKIKKLLKK